MLRFFDAANAVTLAGLGSSLACALLAATGRLAYAVAALIVAGLCDFLDGAVARRLQRTDEERRFGAALDTVVDGCAFGLAPAVLLYAAGMRSPPELALLLFFAVAAVWRLAYFETTGMSGRHYLGLPTTYVALVLPLSMLAGFAGAAPLRIAANASALLLAAAMVSRFKNRKLGGPWYAILLLVALGLITVYVAMAARYPGA